MRPLLLCSLWLALACGAGPDPAPAPASPPPFAEPEDPTAAPAPPASAVVALPPRLVQSTRDPYPLAAGGYPGVQAVDGRQETAWVANGDRLLLHYGPGVWPTQLELVPGYAKSADTWDRNRRPTRLRYRYVRAGAGVFDAVLDDWHSLDWVPAPTLPDDPVLRFDLAAPLGPVRAVEIEVLDATPRTRDDDIAISEIGLRGRYPAAAPVSGATWAYADGLIVAGFGEAGDALEAPWTHLDLSACTARHEGTGGGSLWLIGGRCEALDDGWRMTGTQVDDCGRDTPGPDCGPDRTPGEPVDLTLRVRGVGTCFGVIGGHPYDRCVDSP